MMGLVGLSSFFVESTQNENNDEPKMNLAHHCLFWVHINKTKKDNDEHWLVVNFSRCTKTKQKKMTMNVNLLSSSLGAQKQNKTNNECQLVIIFSRCTETKQNK